MQNPALPQVLITDVDSYLAFHLAKSLIIRNCHVFGVAKKVPEQLLAEDNFTLLDIDINQPLPNHLPPFEMIFYFAGSAKTLSQNLLVGDKRTKIFVLLDIGTKETTVENLIGRNNINVFLIGDIYGPASHAKLNSKIADLIAQAGNSDKIILKNEGRDTVFPTYISDAVYAINKFAFEQDAKKVKIIISQNPQNSLDVAYEIQDQIHKTLGKKINLFFSNDQTGQVKPHPLVRIADLAFEPKFKLEEGLKEIFENFKKAKNLPVDNSQKQTGQPAQFQTEIFNRAHRQHKKLKLPLVQLAKVFAAKKTLAAIFLIALFLFAKTAFDFYMGLKKLEASKAALSAADFTKAESLSRQSAKHLEQAASGIKIFTSPARIIPPGKDSQINSQLQGLIAFSNSLGALATGTQTTAKNLKIILNKDSRETLDLESPRADFQKAYFLAGEAKLLASTNNNFISGKIHPIVGESNVDTTALKLLDFANLMPHFVGAADKKTYLILFQDNTELRAGGGFIDAYGLLQFEKGHLVNISFADIYKADALSKEKIAPPKELTEKLGAKTLFLRDSATSADFETSAQTAREIFEKETGQKVDGVVALDFTFIKSLLEITGAQAIEGGTISAANLMGSYLTIGSKDDFDTEILTKVFQSLSASVSSENTNYLSLLEKITEASRQKHLLVSIDSPTLSPYIKLHNAGNSLPPVSFDPANDRAETRDFLALVEANLGANKANGFLERKIEYSVDLGKSNDLTAHLTITYTNQSKNNIWPQGDYTALLKVLTPPTAFLIDYKDGQTSKLDTVSLNEENSLASFATYLTVPANSTKTVTFTYSLGKTLKLEQAPSYHLYVSKQPGTISDPFSFELNLPQGIQSEKINGVSQSSQEVKQETDLSVDRQFEISLAKK